MTYQSGILTYNNNQDTLPYRIHLPSNTAKPLPVLLYLHGAGERGIENERQLIHIPDFLVSKEFQDKNPCIILAPQCPSESYWAQVKKPEFLVDSRIEPTTAAAGLPLLLDQVIEQHPVDIDRIYVMGLSMGGMGTLDLLARYPERIAGAIAVCGAADTSLSYRYAHIPLRIAHGDADPVVPVDRSRTLAQTLRQLNTSDMEYTEYPDMTHNVWDTTFNNPTLYDWLFKQHKAQ